MSDGLMGPWEPGGLHILSNQQEQSCVRIWPLQLDSAHQPSRPGMHPQTLQLTKSPGNSVCVCVYEKVRVLVHVPEGQPKASAQKKAKGFRVVIISRPELSSPLIGLVQTARLSLYNEVLPDYPDVPKD